MVEITLLTTGQVFDCSENDTILRAALRNGIGMTYSCNVGSCGNCKFEVVEGSVTHLRSDAPASSERDLARNRYLGCQAVPNGPCSIKIRTDPAAMPVHKPLKFRVKVLSKQYLTRDICEFTCAAIDTGPTGFLSGQYALISTASVSGGRAYSMANTLTRKDWTFAIKKVPNGALTHYLFEQVRVGDMLDVDGPYGTAYLRPDTPRDIILMAGGSGLSPMVSIAKAAREFGLLAKKKLHFYYGAREQSDLFDVKSVLQDCANDLTFFPVLSQPLAAPVWVGEVGFLHDIVARDFGENLAQHDIYFAGPPVMARAIQKMAHELGTPMGQLYFDEFY